MQKAFSEQSSETSEGVPQSIAMIMDGNRRWAKERGLPTVQGHRAGYKKMREVAGWCKEVGVQHLAVYAFSTENWNRGPEEVDYLMALMRELLGKGLHGITDDDDVAIHIVGDLALFPQDIQEGIIALHAENAPDAKRHLWVCASYGGKPEILSAVNTLLQEGVHEVDATQFTQRLWTGGMPAPDIILRTGGQRRLSNFLLWHSGYSELFFLDTFWPAFSRKEFDTMLSDFSARTRNYGK